MQITELNAEMQSLLQDRRLLGVFYARVELKKQLYLAAEKDPGYQKDLAKWLYAMFVHFEKGPVSIPESLNASQIYDLRNCVMLLSTAIAPCQLSDQVILPLDALEFFLEESDDQAAVEKARMNIAIAEWQALLHHMLWKKRESPRFWFPSATIQAIARKFARRLKEEVTRDEEIWQEIVALANL